MLELPKVDTTYRVNLCSEEQISACIVYCCSGSTDNLSVHIFNMNQESVLCLLTEHSNLSKWTGHKAITLYRAKRAVGRNKVEYGWETN